jgi:hypothetical protein
MNIKHFHLEVRQAFDNKYLKVFIKDLNQIEEVQKLIEKLPSVKKANITNSNSKSSPSKNLTVYPTYVYSIQELKAEVQTALEGYFSDGIFDPKFIDKTIPELSNSAFSQILDYVIRVGNNLEKYPETAQALDEEKLRDYFLAFLNTVSKRHTAVGEAFNHLGKTDILIQNNNGENIFIAECKIWKGESYLNDAIDQLLERYVNWRDEKLALIVFNKNNLGFSDIIDKAKNTFSNHGNCKKLANERTQTSFTFIFRHPADSSKEIKIVLILFNFV